MIPLRDNVPSGRFPLVNTLLIVANFIVFFHELSIGPAGLTRLIDRWGIIPARLAPLLHHPSIGALPAYATLVSAQFIHGGWLHILGNMLFLFIFGDNVEDRMGHARYLFFYLLVGVVANAVYVLVSPASAVPTIGASGAIAGVLGAYLVSYPRARVLTLIILVIFVTVVRLPAWIFLLYWFFLQVISGFATLPSAAAAASGVAWWAHIGGFVAGALLIHLFAERRLRPYPS